MIRPTTDANPNPVICRALPLLRTHRRTCSRATKTKESAPQQRRLIPSHPHANSPREHASKSTTGHTTDSLADEVCDVSHFQVARLWGLRASRSCCTSSAKTHTQQQNAANLLEVSLCPICEFSWVSPQSAPTESIVACPPRPIYLSEAFVLFGLQSKYNTIYCCTLLPCSCTWCSCKRSGTYFAMQASSLAQYLIINPIRVNLLLYHNISHLADIMLTARVRRPGGTSPLFRAPSALRSILTFWVSTSDGALTYRKYLRSSPGIPPWSVSFCFRSGANSVGLFDEIRIHRLEISTQHGGSPTPHSSLQSSP